MPPRRSSRLAKAVVDVPGDVASEPSPQPRSHIPRLPTELLHAIIGPAASTSRSTCLSLRLAARWTWPFVEPYLYSTFIIDHPITERPLPALEDVGKALFNSFLSPTPRFSPSSPQCYNLRNLWITVPYYHQNTTGDTFPRLLELCPNLSNIVMDRVDFLSLLNIRALKPDAPASPVYPLERYNAEKYGISYREMTLTLFMPCDRWASDLVSQTPYLSYTRHPVLEMVTHLRVQDRSHAGTWHPRCMSTQNTKRPDLAFALFPNVTHLALGLDDWRVKKEDYAQCIPRVFEVIPRLETLVLPVPDHDPGSRYRSNKTLVLLKHALEAHRQDPRISLLMYRTETLYEHWLDEVAEGGDSMWTRAMRDTEEAIAES